MKFSVITGNPMITKTGENTFYIIYYNAKTSKIEEYKNITKEIALKLPFVDGLYLDLLG